MRKGPIAFALMCLQHVMSLALPAAGASDVVLTNVSQVLSLTEQEAAQDLPVRIRASVTFADRTSALLFVQDETDGIFVGLEQRVPVLRFGQVVEVSGRTDPGVHLRAIRRATLKVFDEVRPPPVKPTTVENFMAGRDDCDFTSVSGVVRGVGRRNGQVTLTISLGPGQHAEAVFVDGRNLANLWDAKVRVRGVAGMRSMHAGNVIGVALYCWDKNAITIEQPGIYDPFFGRKGTVREALAETNSGRRVRISGRFVGEAPQGLLIEDRVREQIIVHGARPRLLRTNDRVQASGFVAQKSGAAILEEARMRIMAPRKSTNGTVPADSPLFTRISDIRHDPGVQSTPGAPVRIQGVVTFYDRGWMLFVQDESEGIFVAPQGRRFPVSAGQLVEIEGFTDPGDYAPIIVDGRMTVLGRSGLPAAKPVRHEELMLGREDSQRVEIAGVVRSVRKDPNGAVLDLSVSGGRIRTFLFQRNEALPIHLIDAAVRVRGVCGSYFNDRRQFTGVQLYVASLADIDVDDPAPEDTFAAEVQPIANLMQFGSSASRRVKVSGTATLVAPALGLLAVQDSSGGVLVRGSVPSYIRLGDRVEAAGFPTTGGYTPMLSESIVRRAGPGTPIYPRAVRAADALTGNYDGELITVEGRLLEQFQRDSTVVLVVESGGVVFEAALDAASWRAGGRTLDRQARLRLTGICLVQVNESLAPAAFKLLLRTPSDAALLASPPWWMEPRVRRILVVAGLLAVAAVACVALLRRKIREQTGVIREQLEREQRLNDSLEAKVQERTAELTRANASLEEARNDLERRVSSRTSELSALNKSLTEEIAVRRQTEEALRLGEERFRLLTLATNDVVWDWDLKRDVVWWSDAVESSFGHSRLALEPGVSAWARLIHPDDRNRTESVIHEVIGGGRCDWSDEYRFGHADGSYRHVMDRGYVIRDGAGAAIRMIGIMTDITARKEAEASLRISEEQFSKAFRGSPVPMAISTLADGRYIDVNEAFLEMLEFSREQVIGHCSTELGIWRHAEQRGQMVEALRKSKLIRDWRVEFCTSKGEVRQVLGSAEIIHLKGEPCLVAIFTDLTPRLQLEAQLRQAQKMEAVGQLAAGIAHDFNNILTVVQGHVGLLQAGAASQNPAASLDEIRQAADRAANLTRQLLTFSRRQPVQPQRVELNDVIREMSTMLRRLLGEQIELRHEPGPPVASVRADRGMIEQVMMNLAVNARDAMPEGGALTFAARVLTIDDAYAARNAEARPGRFVRVTVADTGCGMSPATKSRVFEPFFTTKAAGKGTGLGLATVYGIVKQHEGWIELESELNQGTTFHIYLPHESAREMADSAEPHRGEVRGGSETILLVEDEPGVRRLAENVLSRHGYTVLTASDGHEALAVWKDHAEEIDLVLTDMVMPEGMTGRELAERLRASSPNLKFIYTSGYSVELAQSDFVLREGVNFLPKPYPAGELAAVVRACLDRADCPAPAP